MHEPWILVHQFRETELFSSPSTGIIGRYELYCMDTLKFRIKIISFVWKEPGQLPNFCPECGANVQQAEWIA